jgi:hypothetical protein
MDLLRGGFAITLGGASGLFTAACGCPTVAGPTAPVVSFSATLAPGEFRYLDANTPKDTTQINLQFTVSSVGAPLRVRQVDPGCLPATADSCAAFAESVLSARPPGVTTFGNSLSVTGTQTRILVQNMSTDETITLALSVEPRRAGCT